MLSHYDSAVNFLMPHRVKSPPSDRATGKLRLDLLLVERALASTRAQAQALILAGKVFSGEQRLDKSGQLVARDVELRLSEDLRYVSRGGFKLEGALDALEIRVADRICADIGASTGGFTDCLLQRGARRVFAVDVGEHQLANKLVADPRVVVMDRTNARHLTRASFDEPIELAVVDASFIGIEKLLPALGALLAEGAQLLALVKPQFEAGRAEAARARGVIRDPALRARLIETARVAFDSHGFSVVSGADSVLAGPKGNREHFLLAVRRARS